MTREELDLDPIVVSLLENATMLRIAAYANGESFSVEFRGDALRIMRTRILAAKLDTAVLRQRRAAAVDPPPAITLQRLKDALAKLEGPCGVDDREAAYAVCAAAKAYVEAVDPPPDTEPKP